MTELHQVQEKLLKLKRVLLLKNTKKLIILTHENPDPDSIASALTLSTIIRSLFNVPCVVRYTGMIGRPENRQMIRLLNLKIKKISDKELNSKVDFAMVDSQPHTGNSALPKKINPLIVFDHHPLRRTTKAEFIEIHEDYGATATILGEYILGSGLEVSGPLATALCYGISSETQSLGREAGPKDTHVYLTLFPMASKKILSKIENPKLPRNYFTTLSRALHHAYVYKHAIISNLGDIAVPDFVPVVADLMLRCERMSWSMCLGRFNNKILISLRTSREKAQAGQLLRSLLGKKGTAGGHQMIAGGQVPCDKISEDQCDRLEKELIAEFLKKIGYREIGDLTPLLVQES